MDRNAPVGKDVQCGGGCGATVRLPKDHVPADVDPKKVDYTTWCATCLSFVPCGERPGCAGGMYIVNQVDVCAKHSVCDICGSGWIGHMINHGYRYHDDCIPKEMYTSAYILNMYVPSLNAFICGRCSEDCAKCHSPVISCSSPWDPLPGKYAMYEGKLYCGTCSPKCDCDVPFCQGEDTHVECYTCFERVMPKKYVGIFDKDPEALTEIMDVNGINHPFHFKCIGRHNGRLPKDVYAAESSYHITADGRVWHKSSFDCPVCKTQTNERTYWMRGPDGPDDQYGMYHKKCHEVAKTVDNGAKKRSRSDGPSGSSSAKTRKTSNTQ